MQRKPARDQAICLTLLMILAAGGQNGTPALAEGDPPLPAAHSPSGMPFLPSDLPLLSRDSITYVGAFSVPNQDGNGHSLGYAGHALTFYADHQSLFYGGHDWYQELCEIGIPDIIDLSQSAPILQNCTDVTEDRLSLVDEDSIKLGGTLVYQDRLIVSAYSYYDADGDQVLSHFASGLDLSSNGDINGPYPVGDWAGIVSGYMTHIPTDWQSLLGGTALTGNCCLAIISRTSYGPAVSAFDPENVGVLDPIPAQPLLYYPAAHPLADWDATSPYFNGNTNIVGVAFPEGSRSILFIGRQGIGEFCYGTGAECEDPVDDSKGTHAYPYVHQIWAYNAADLQAVKDGLIEAWEVQPYGLWQLDEMDSTGGATISGATYDPLSGRLYITEQYGESPAVHVYQIAVESSVPYNNQVFLPLMIFTVP